MTKLENVHLFVLSSQGFLQTELHEISVVIVGITRNSCSFHTCTQFCLPSVLICDLHKKMELSPSIPPAQERDESLRLTHEYACHTLPLCGRKSLTFHGMRERTPVLRLKRARLVFPRTEFKKNFESPQIGS